ncbi:Lipase member H-A [Folsomia candida]|uniref:Lipase member H-A n=1 Tax=Folsomia candida TaxID=158441 RepID=A0A226E6S8_FOLCA|nr:Lipase member H-A [Folsomia candida]
MDYKPHENCQHNSDDTFGLAHGFDLPILNEEEDAILSPDYPLSSNPDDIKFYLYPKNADPQYEQELVFNNRRSVINSSFNNSALKTVLLIHGFTDNRTVHLDRVVLPAYLNSPLNYNFIVVDWGLLSGNVHFDNLIEQFEIYKTVVSTNIPIVANRTAEFIKFLGVDPSTVHLVGHSLGAHVSGNTGRNYQSLTNGKKLARITGLDPAGPLFLLPRFPFPKIHRGNADFVDVIHTCMGELGDVAMDGDVDFFPNGGVNQPGCDFLQGLPTLNSCSHQFAVKLYAASITRNFPSCKCINADAVTGLISPLKGVDLQVCLDNCPTDVVQLGENCPPTARGFYSLRTSSDP